MVIDEGQRLRLVGRLHQVLGADAADTLMGYLPPAGWADVATKQDLAELRAEMAEMRGDLRTEMADLRGDLRAEMADLRGELRAELHTTITTQTRTLFLGLVGVMVAYGGGLVAAVHLR